MATQKTRSKRSSHSQVSSTDSKTLLRQAAKYLGVNVVSEAVCEGHCAPLDFFHDWILHRPSLSLVLGPRGGGKSYLSALATHFDSMSAPCHQTKVLGGSEAQSAQIYQALKSIADHRDSPLMAVLTATKADYGNGSEVSYIPASSRSVRGPHVHSLRLDEVDEMDSDIRESAFGMCMGMDGIPASISMTSTWHRVGGPMSELLERGEGGDFPVYRFCVWEVLEKCPDSRSGKSLENCPACPLLKWCHGDRDGHGRGLPKAKRSSGHYTIDSLIQKVKGISARVFESDYLCSGPRADGVWFSQFDEAANVSVDAEFDPRLPVYVSIDSGVFTGAVFLQVRDVAGGHHVNVFADYLREGISAESAAREILDLFRQYCGSTERYVSTDAAGGARNPVGPTVIAEYERVGLRGRSGIQQWPKYPGCIQVGLATIEAMVKSADGVVRLKIHPRCRGLISAFRSYARAKRAGQWQDYPEDPQHPAEDLMDALRGQLALLFPEGRKPQPNFNRLPAGKVF